MKCLRNAKMMKLCQICTVHYTETEFIHVSQSVMITFVTSVKNKQESLYFCYLTHLGYGKH